MAVPSRIKLLVIEDDSAVRQFVAKTLTGAGYEVIEAQGGVEGMAAILSLDGDIPLVIVDLVMPGGSGLDFASQLQVERPDTKILFVSGFGDCLAAEGIRRVAPTAVLEKPFSAVQLVERVRQLLADGAGQ